MCAIASDFCTYAQGATCTTKLCSTLALSRRTRDFTVNVQHLMERPTNNVTISKAASLSIQLRIGRRAPEAERQKQAAEDSDATDTTTNREQEGKMSSLLPSPMFDSPIQQSPAVRSQKISLGKSHN